MDTPSGAVADASDFGFDLFSPELVRDPYPVYARLREGAPLASIPRAAHPRGRVLIATAYQDVSAVAGDASRFTSDSRNVYPDGTGWDPSMISQDPPAHTRLRSRVATDFTPKRVAALEDSIRRIVDERLHAALAKGTFDLIADLALPVPVMVICELLGIPEQDRAGLANRSHEFIDNTTVNTPAGRQAVQAAYAAIWEYFDGFVAARQSEPNDGLVSALLRQSEDPLTSTELVAMCHLMLIAGHETTVNLIGNGVRTLLRHPEQWRLLVEDPELAAGAVEESLRFEPPVQLTHFRASTQDVELAGVELGAGEQILAVIAAANRDPAAIEVSLPDEEIEASGPLPAGWQQDLKVTRELGSRWLRSGSALALCVPTVLVPDGVNLLVNPAHAAAGRMEVSRRLQFRWDERLS